VLASGTLYYFQAVAINPTGTTYGAVEHFETLGVPTVQTGTAEEVTATSARLGSLLEPNKLNPGGEAEYYVEYGTEPCSVNTNSCGTKSATAFVSGKVQASVGPIVLSGLEPNTIYHYWLVANNSAASKPVHGEAKEFTTRLGAPLTGLAEDVTTTSAQITGELNPGGRGEAEYWVEYLLPSNEVLRSATALAIWKVQASLTPIVLTGLQPNTTYYYWLVARSSAVSEPVRGEAHKLTTPISQAELEAQAAAARKPAEELAAANAAKQKLEAEEAKRVQEAAAVNAAKQKQYDEIAAETAGLLRLEAEAGKQKAKAKKAKPKPASCRKGFVKKKNKCVRTKSKKKGKVKK
jgi:phosphodiesterase/alkaline phosphatase D-like protein